MDLVIATLGSSKYGATNCGYVSTADFAKLQSLVPAAAAGAPATVSVHGGPDATANIPGIHCSVNQAILVCVPLPEVPEGTLQMGVMQRNACVVPMGKPIRVDPAVSIAPLASATIKVSALQQNAPISSLNATELGAEITAKFIHHAFKRGQIFAIVHKAFQLKLQVEDFEFPEEVEHKDDYGMLTKATDISLAKTPESTFKLEGVASTKAKQLVGRNFNFAQLGIGGLDAEFETIFRRAFSNRMLPPAVLANLGISPVRGMLLYGPPGCGKTLIARKIGQALNAHEPKVVNGPEVLSKWVGGSEEKIRELFADAEKEQSERGADSDLHLIIFDEIDAICKARGSTRDSTGVHDSVVNQLLSKIDGVNSLGNILIIGMTNRKDLIDEALLRPGRLEVHVEIGLPDEPGRRQILDIHTALMRKNNYMAPDVDLDKLARLTKNFTGAEIAGFVSDAAAFATRRVHDPTRMGEIDKRALASMKVTMADFEAALKGCHPAFGSQDEELGTYYRNGVVPWGAPFLEVQDRLRQFVNGVARSTRINLVSILLCGRPGSGKSALAARIGKDSGFPFVKRIGADTLVGYGEAGKQNELVKLFQDSYKSPRSIVIIDDVERIIEYVRMGPRFSNIVLQTLMVLVTRPPPTSGTRSSQLVVICTTSNPGALAELGVTDLFKRVDIPCLSEKDHFMEALHQFAVGGETAPSEEALGRIAERLAATGTEYPIKSILEATDMATQAATSAEDFEDEFVAAAIDIGLRL